MDDSKANSLRTQTSVAINGLVTSGMFMAAIFASSLVGTFFESGRDRLILSGICIAAGIAAALALAAARSLAKP